MTNEPNNSRDLLKDAIREASGNAAPAVPGGRAESAKQRKITIAEALQEQQGIPAVKPGPRAVRTSDATQSDLRRSPSASLHAVLAEVGAGGTATPAPSSARAATDPGAATLAEAVSGVETQGSTTTTGTAAPRHRWSGIAVVLVLIAGATYWWSQQPPTGPAAALRALSQGVDQHRTTHNGKLPESLVQIETFPKNAIEWPPRYWKARDAAGRTEIIWVPQNRHYRILLRQGNEVWTVSDREPEPKPLMKGNP